MLLQETTEEQAIMHRNDTNVCHLIHKDETLHEDERIITTGRLTGIITPVECSDHVLLVGESLLAAIQDETLIVDLSKNLYPDVAKIINKYVSEMTPYGFVIHPSKWTVNGEVFPAELSEWNMETGELKSAESANNWLVGNTDYPQEWRSKMATIYVDNVMDAAYHSCNGNSQMPIDEMLNDLSQMHNRLRVEGGGMTVATEVISSFNTLKYTNSVIDDMTSLIRGYAGVAVDRTSTMKPSFLKRLLTMYVSYRAEVPYYPPTIQEIKDNIS